jgi:phytoene dehydrogenase-like protein
MHRREFIQLSAGLTGYGLLAASCGKPAPIPGEIVGASAHIGHMLRDQSFGTPVSTTKAAVVIIGGGISALSAARWLYRNGVRDLVILDLEKQVGGNAAWGSNKVSAYSWGAHYVPVANNNLPEYLQFLEECKVITGYNEKGWPVYDEYFLCSDPQERLYINGGWQNGLVPQLGVPGREQEEIRRFLEQMNVFRQERGKDGRDAFAIPVDNSSKDQVYAALDNTTMEQWLLQNNYTGKYLHWYVNYCTRDDFGTTISQISAWAGIHYFASRKGLAANAETHDVLTWPQGNGWLAEQLIKDLTPYIHHSSVAVKVLPGAGQVAVHYYDVNNKTLKAIEAQHCIMAVPQFVANRLLPSDPVRIALVSKQYSYIPWMVANITVDQLEERSGAPLSWDNVLYNSDSLGYVDATHQQLQQLKPQKVLTYYFPLVKNNVIEERKKAQQRTHAQWVELIMNDLRIIHPDIAQKTKRIDVMVWGHAMLQPLPGIIHGPVRPSLQQSVNGNIHFAHTDLAGISIFEEAFYQGIKAAGKVIG